jgi:hypothetical protein
MFFFGEGGKEVPMNIEVINCSQTISKCIKLALSCGACRVFLLLTVMYIVYAQSSLQIIFV